jgi:hypothetical protein
MSSGLSEPMNDITYDFVTLLSNMGEAVDALNCYIEDAKNSNDPAALQVFEQIREDEIKHCDLLRDAICDKVKQGSF